MGVGWAGEDRAVLRRRRGIGRRRMAESCRADGPARPGLHRAGGACHGVERVPAEPVRRDRL